MQVELTKFRVKQGKSELVDEWMAFLNENMQDVLVTLDGEKMFIETIMRDKIGEHEYLYWYSVQSDHGGTSKEIQNCIDAKHLQYWDKCIDKTFRPRDLKNEVVMIPNHLRDYMSHHE
ncbi:DUF6176 family protein [Corticicoccus populi]|uniref:DUF6176 family protein n=1 Tax=Corticicoccus populi TaxID=1812821 RepID=A0ABW5WXL3_9STAP